MYNNHHVIRNSRWFIFLLWMIIWLSACSTADLPHEGDLTSFTSILAAQLQSLAQPPTTPTLLPTSLTPIPTPTMVPPASSPSPASPHFSLTIHPLRQYAPAHNLYIGAAVSPKPLLEDPYYAAVLGHEYNLLTPENAMKFEFIHPEPGFFDFTQADVLVEYAEQHGMTVRGHTLVWHLQLADWVEAVPCDQMEAVLKDHIETIVGHYRGQVYAWDVINEGIGDDGKLRDTIWLRCIGPDYIEKAFTWAYAADPAAKLFYNDYDIELQNQKSSGVYELVASLVNKGIPIHGVGIQMHLVEAPPAAYLAKYMGSFADLGLEVQITEMDVRLPEPPTSETLIQQADIYRLVLRVCLEAPNCTAFVTWGFTDRYSWVPEFFPGFGSALVFDADYVLKPAYIALREELGKGE